MKRMAARPLKLSSKKMNHPLPIRFTAEQRQMIDEAADSMSLEPSAWVRMVTVEAAKKRIAELRSKR